MTIAKMAPARIADIEKQIAKVTTELHKARALQYATAKNALLIAKEQAVTAKEKVNVLKVKGGDTVLTQQRLAKAAQLLTDKESTLESAQTELNALRLAQETALQFATDVARVLSGKKLSKKIKPKKTETTTRTFNKKTEKKIVNTKNKIKKLKARLEKIKKLP
jgi:hypothetical protein